MGLLQSLGHLVNFFLPAAVMGLIMAGPARAWLTPPERRTGFWTCWMAQGLLGMVVLSSGLMLYGRDGKVGTYAALVISAATLQWLMGRGWRG